LLTPAPEAIVKPAKPAKPRAPKAPRPKAPKPETPKPETPKADTRTVVELKAACKAAGLKGYSKLKRDELLSLLNG
jgi:hypothetical protein